MLMARQRILSVDWIIITLDVRGPGMTKWVIANGCRFEWVVHFLSVPYRSRNRARNIWQRNVNTGNTKIWKFCDRSGFYYSTEARNLNTKDDKLRTPRELFTQRDIRFGIICVESRCGTVIKKYADITSESVVQRNKYWLLLFVRLRGSRRSRSIDGMFFPVDKPFVRWKDVLCNV